MSSAPMTPQDRRRFRRSVVGMPLQAVRHTTSQNDPRRIVGLRVLNVSRGGVGAISQESIPVSEALTLFFPPLGPGRGRDAPGQVVHCQDCGDHFAVGIAFEEPWPEREELRAD
jgi:hypothetical protein